MNNASITPLLDESTIDLAQVIHIYHGIGFTPFPLPVGEKHPPPRDITGDIPEVSDEHISELWDGLSDGVNIGIRLPRHLIALDVDHYDGKSGKSEFDALCGQLGDLPATYSLTRRGAYSPSRHLYFTVPAGTRLHSQAGQSIEVLQNHHRYGVAFPSVCGGDMYRWYGLDGEPIGVDQLPHTSEFPALPGAWLSYLQTDGEGSSLPRGEAVGLTDTLAWLEAHTCDYTAEIPPMYATKLAEFAEHPDGYEPMRDLQWFLVRDAVERGTSGVGTALDTLRELLETKYADRGASHRLAAAEGEFSKALRDGVARVRKAVEAREIRCARTTVDRLSEQLDAGSLPATLERADSPSDGLSCSEGATVAGLRFVAAADVETGVPDWAWKIDNYGAIPLGGLTIITGKGGDGKSTLCRWLAARISKGELEGMWHGEPHRVLYLAAEESTTFSVAPSLEVNGADMRRVMLPENAASNFKPIEEMDELIEFCKDNDIRAVFVDPITNFFGGKDSHRNSEVRDALAPWSRLADEINGVVVAIAHQTKGAGGDITAGVGGSSAITEVARAVLGTAHDKETDVRVLSGGKNNAGGLLPAYEYQLVSRTFTPTKGDTEGEAMRFELGRRSQFTADEVQLRNKARSSGDTQTAKSWLRELLTDAGGDGMKKSDIVAKAIGLFSESSLEKAKKDLRLVKTTQDNKAFWSLPA